jgi:gliding motility-associated protein GldM
MAGGKETPRQKLIGLMYLVLLALLALQVSSAILQKFQFLNSSLELAVRNANEANDKQVSGIEKAVEKSPKYKYVLEEAQRIKKMSRDMINEIDSYKEEIVKETGCDAGAKCTLGPPHIHGKDEKGAYKGLKDEDKTAHLMVGDPSTGKKGKAYGLKDRLNNFITELNKIVGNELPPFPPLAQDGKDDPLTKTDPEQKNKDFAELNFGHTPMIAAMAVLSDKQSKITAYESNVLAFLAKKVGATDFKVGKMVADYSALSSTVAAGTDYEAKMFLSAKLDVTPVMKFRGNSVKVEDGVGIIKFKASATNYDAEGNSKQQWEGQVTVPKPTGDGDTTFKVKGEYIVAKPVIDVKSASVSALYYNCGNDLNIQVPALGASYKPSFSARGANIINGKEKGAIIVIPTVKGADAKVSIAVSSEGSAIGSKEFPVRGVPRPQIVAKIAGNPVDQKRGVPAPGPASITVLAEPDPSFAAALPREARYSITEGEVTLARGKREIQNLPIRSDNVNLGSIRQQAQAGDRIIIVIKKAKRLNFRDEAEDVPINPASSVITIPVN